jgi:hypothetical protein
MLPGVSKVLTRAVPVYVDSRLAGKEMIEFDAGTHSALAHLLSV